MAKIRSLLFLAILFLSVGITSAQDQPAQVKFPAASDSAASLIEARDNARTSLKGSLSAIATTIQVQSTDSFPVTGLLIIDNREIASYTGKTSSTFTGVLRGQQGTAALVHAAGVTVEQRIFAANHNTLSQAIRALEAKLGSGTGNASTGKFLKGTGAALSAWQNLTSGDVIAALGFTPANAVNSVAVRAIGGSPTVSGLVTLEFQPSSGFVVTNQGGGVARVDLGAIPFARLPALTSDKALITNGSGVISVSSLASAQLAYLANVTSDIQAQINNKPSPVGSGSEIQVRVSPTALGAVTGSSASGANLTLAGIFTAPRIVATPGANQIGISLTGYSVTGSNTTSAVDISGTWSTSAAPTALRVNISDTGSDASALLTNLLVDNQSKFKVDKAGNVTIAGNLNVVSCSGCTGSTAHNMLSGSHTDTVSASAVRGDVITAQGGSPAWKRLAIGSAGAFLGNDGTDVGWHAVNGTTNQITVNQSSGDLIIATPQNIHTGATPQFARLGLAVAADAATSIKITGPALSTNADLAIALFDASMSVTKNDSNTRAFSGLSIIPTLNTGGSNANTTLNIINVDTVNTGVTGMTTNLINLSYGGSSKFKVDSAGVGTLAGALTVASCSGCTITHSVLSGTHGDSTAASAVRGDLITGQGASPKWARLAKGSAGNFVGTDGTDVAWRTLSGTSNQVTVGQSSGNITLSTPQDIHTAATPQFARMGIGAAAGGANLLTVVGGTVTADTQVLNLTQTWNNGAVTFTALKLNVTDSSSDASSLLADLQVGGVSKFKIDKGGNLTVTSCVGCTGSTAHSLLSSTHTDSTTASVVRGDLIVGKSASPTWQRLAIGSAGNFVGTDGTDTLWRTLSGTTNQIAVALSSGNITLSLGSDVPLLSANNTFLGVNTLLAAPVGESTLGNSAIANVLRFADGSTGTPQTANTPSLYFQRVAGGGTRGTPMFGWNFNLQQVGASQADIYGFNLRGSLAPDLTGGSTGGNYWHVLSREYMSVGPTNIPVGSQVTAYEKWIEMERTVSGISAYAAQIDVYNNTSTDASTSTGSINKTSVFASYLGGDPGTVNGGAHNTMWAYIQGNKRASAYYGLVPDADTFNRVALKFDQMTATLQGVWTATNGSATISPTSYTITGATNATPVVITTSATNALYDGAPVTVASVGGNTAANGTFFAHVLSGTTFALYSNTYLTTGVAGNGSYTSGGTVITVGHADVEANEKAWLSVNGTWVRAGASATFNSIPLPANFAGSTGAGLTITKAPAAMWVRENVATLALNHAGTGYYEVWRPTETDRIKFGEDGNAVQFGSFTSYGTNSLGAPSNTLTAGWRGVGYEASGSHYGWGVESGYEWLMGAGLKFYTGNTVTPTLSMTITSTHMFLNPVVAGISPGTVSIGAPSASLIANEVFHVQGGDGATQATLDAYAGFNSIVGRRANTSSASPSALATNDTILSIAARGWHNGGGFTSTGSSAITFVASQAWTGSDSTTPTAIGSYITFGTVPNGGTSRSERWRIESGGWLVGSPLSANVTTAELSSSSQGAIYIKGGKLVISYNDAGTLRFKYLDLTSTGVTWTHTTTPP